MKIYDVVIVGAGPGGIASAIECKKMGIENIVLLEKTDNISAMIREYYKDGKRVDKDTNNHMLCAKFHIICSPYDKHRIFFADIIVVTLRLNTPLP